MTDVFTGLTGAGEVTFAARNVPLVGVEVTFLPPASGLLDAGDPKRVMRVGWIALCWTGDDPGWPAVVFCAPPMFVDFERMGAWPAKLGVFGDRIRYSFATGAIVNLYVNS